MMDEQKEIKVSIAMHGILGIAVVLLSFWLSFSVTKYAAIGLGLAILVAAGFTTEKLVGKKGLKWWASHGVILYLFSWLVSWIFFFNL